MGAPEPPLQLLPRGVSGGFCSRVLARVCDYVLVHTWRTLVKSRIEMFENFHFTIVKVIELFVQNVSGRCCALPYEQNIRQNNMRF